MKPVDVQWRFTARAAPTPSVVRVLAPIMAVVLVAYLIIGLAMPVLPLYVHQRLGLSTFMVGVAAGVEFAAALATMGLPLVALLFVAPLPSLPPSAHESPSIARVLRAVSVPGLGVALTAVGFGTISTFASLMFAERGWGAAWVAFTVLSVTFILGRVVFGHLPDRVGGARVALVCVLVEAVGLALIWLAPAAPVVFVGAAITGVGYSLVYPGFGLEAVRLAPPEAKGLAMGAFTAFLDLSLGVSSPALGLVASRAGLGSVFLVSTVVVLAAAPVAVRLLRAPARGSARA
jgi:predicted MFS family arabinose efflux permease